jgi:hypothetical protein
MPIRQPKHNVYRYFDLILGLFVAALLISNISAVKLISFGPIITDGGAILFPFTYIFGDILTEVYGYSYARRAIWTAFMVMLIASVTFLIIGWAPAAPEWGNQDAYIKILGFVPRIAVASLVAFLFGQFINSFFLAKLKIITKGKSLWTRLLGSTVVGELFDTTIFAIIAFGGILVGLDMVRFILIGWIFKTVVEAIMLPVTYRMISFLKIKEKEDKYDYKTDFSPFHINVE